MARVEVERGWGRGWIGLFHNCAALLHGQDATMQTKDSRVFDLLPSCFGVCLRSVQVLQPDELADMWDGDKFLQLATANTCHPTLSLDQENSLQINPSPYFTTPLPLTTTTTTPTKPPRSNCLHPVIRQINGRAWNVAFTSTKVKCCSEGVAFRLWLVDYAPRNPLNAGIIWWSCQFAVCALSVPQSPRLLPRPRQSRLCCRRLLRRIWSSGRRRYTLEGGTRGRPGSSPPPLTPPPPPPRPSLRSEC